MGGFVSRVFTIFPDVRRKTRELQRTVPAATARRAASADTSVAQGTAAARRRRRRRPLLSGSSLGVPDVDSATGLQTTLGPPR
jgi:hypothetical protein